MAEDGASGLLMLILGGVTLLSVPLSVAFARLSLPGAVAFIALGLALSAGGRGTPLLTPPVEDQIGVLARIGIVALLFRVGLESNLDQLAGQLRRASAIWLPNMLVPAALVFVLIWAWPGLGTIPALLASVAASATSISVSVAAWEETGTLGTEDGALLLDVAELDDLSAVVLLGIVFAVAPALRQGVDAGVLGEAALASSWQFVKIAAFCAACYGFSRLVERPVSALFAGFDRRVGPFVFAAGTVFVISALADALGFSMAIGALFAGLAFSRDPAERQIDHAFAYILAIFRPFFFVSIGLSVSFEGIGGALALAAALFAVLVAGKLVGAGLPAWALADRRTGLLIGASMVPRAEIYLIVMLHGLGLGAWAIPTQLYTAAVLASIGTCILGPLLVLRLLGGRERVRSA